MVEMVPEKIKIFIFEGDAVFRSTLEVICSRIGDTTAAETAESAIQTLTRQNYDLLLLDWKFNKDKDWALFLFSEIDDFQSKAERLALFPAQDLGDVVSAVKSGFRDVLFAGQDQAVLEKKIRESLADSTPKKSAHHTPTSADNALIEKAYYQKQTLFQAEKKFTKYFLERLMAENQFTKKQVAALMKISYKSLERYLKAKDPA